MIIKFRATKTIVEYYEMNSKLNIPDEIINKYKQKDGKYDFQHLLEDINNGMYKQELKIDDLSDIQEWECTSSHNDKDFQVQEIKIIKNL